MNIDAFKDHIETKLRGGMRGPFGLTVDVANGEVLVRASLVRLQGFAPENTDEQNLANADAFVEGFLAELQRR